MSAPFKYFVTDMDGTLLSPSHVITDYTRDTLKTLVNDFGVTLILATGRNAADVKIVSNNLRKYIWGDEASAAHSAGSSPDSSAPPLMFLLTSNGAVAHNAVTGEVVFCESIDPVLADKLYHHLASSEEVVNTNIYQNDDWIARIDWPEMNSNHKESGLSFLHVPEPPRLSAEPVPTPYPAVLDRGIAIGDYSNITKLFYITDDAARFPALAEEVAQITASCGANPVSLTYSASDCMDIMAEGVCKGQGLRKLFSSFLPPQEGHDVMAEALAASIAFGDGLNDAEMLVEVGKGCVMGNANPKLKAQHPELEVVQSNAEDGVAKKLRSAFGIPL